VKWSSVTTGWQVPRQLVRLMSKTCGARVMSTDEFSGSVNCNTLTKLRSSGETREGQYKNTHCNSMLQYNITYIIVLYSVI
jgi:hypothetical protein